MSTECFRPSWGRRFHQETVHHALDFRIEKLNRGGYEVKMIGGGFLAVNFENLMERLVQKKHLEPEILLEVAQKIGGDEGKKSFTSWYLNYLQSDDRVWKIPLKQDQVLEA